MTRWSRLYFPIFVASALALGLGAYLASRSDGTAAGEKDRSPRSQPVRPPPAVGLAGRTPMNAGGSTATAGPVDLAARTVVRTPDQISTAFLDERASFLKNALALGPGQPERLRALLMRYLPDRQALLKAAAAPDGDEAAVEVLLHGAEAMRDLRRSGAFASEVRAMLRPDQQTRWDASLQKMSADDAEVMSMRELSSIQARFPLTEKQKDDIYRTLNEIARTELADRGVTLQDPERDEQQINQRLQALIPFVSDAKREVLRRALDTASAERWFLPLEPLEVFGQ